MIGSDPRLTGRRHAGLRLVGVLAGLALMLSACGGRPSGVLLPVEQVVDGTARVDMLVATTRAPSPDRGILFSGERGREISLLDMSVSIPPAARRKVGEVQWPERVPGNPATDFVVARADTITFAQGRVLLFVHGYNNKFDDAVFRFAQFSHDAGGGVVPVLFTWPSRGSTFGYTYDRESTNFSRDALESVIRELAAEPAVRDVTILAHSMGNWPTMEALRQIALGDRLLPAKLRNVIMASPDVDVDVFAKQVSRLGPRRPRMTLMVSNDDIALNISTRIWGGDRRLGLVDPETEPARTILARNRIEVIDLSAIKSGDSLHHGKFAAAPEVVRFIGNRLLAGQTLQDDRASLGEGIANVATGVGRIAGTILIAPIAIVDERTREHLGERLADGLDPQGASPAP
jgi:esterase/lipase superfamily enzyme